MQAIWGISGKVVFLTFVIWTVFGSFAGWLLGRDDHQPRVGEACGPRHHWTYVRNNITNPELWCEPD